MLIFLTFSLNFSVVHILLKHVKRQTKTLYIYTYDNTDANSPKHSEAVLYDYHNPVNHKETRSIKEARSIDDNYVSYTSERYTVSHVQ